MTLSSNHVIAKMHVTMMMSRDPLVTLKEKIWTSGGLTQAKRNCQKSHF